VSYVKIRDSSGKWNLWRLIICDTVCIATSRRTLCLIGKEYIFCERGCRVLTCSEVFDIADSNIEVESMSAYLEWSSKINN
jgi:hypothetical protein